MLEAVLFTYWLKTTSQRLHIQRISELRCRNENIFRDGTWGLGGLEVSFN